MYMVFSSADGYIRMSLAALQSVPLTHLVSGFDEDTQDNDGGPAVPITGYSEWTSAGSPAVSIGWDWQLQMIRDGMLLTLINEPRSNIMLQDQCQADLGPATTRRLLCGFVDSLAWRQEVAAYLKVRCG